MSTPAAPVEAAPVAAPVEVAAVAAPAVAAPEVDAGGFIDSIDSFFANPPEIAEPAEPKAAEPKKIESKKTAEVKPVEAENPMAELEDEPKDWTPQAARRFKELKAELKTTKALAEERQSALAQREARLAELEATANSPELTAMQERLAEYEQKMILTNLEKSHAYQIAVEKPLAALVKQSDAIAEKYKIDADQLLEVLSLTDEATQDEQLSELLVSASDRDKHSVFEIIKKIQPVMEQRRVLHENAQEALREAEAYDQQLNQQSLIEKSTRRREAAQAVVTTLEKNIPFLEALGTNTADLVKHAADQDPSALDPVHATYNAMAAKLLPKVVNSYKELQKEVDKLAEQLADYDKATPRAGGGSASKNSPVAAGMSFADAVNAALGG